MMICIYEMCPRCRDELIERKQPFLDQDSVNYCPKCGEGLVVACVGEQKIDDTTYKIILNDASLTDHMNRKKRFLEVLMKMGNFTFDEALEKCEIKDSVIFEGDTREVYINMHLFDDFSSVIKYTVVPEFPFLRTVAPFNTLCPTCGSHLINKSGGTFCVKCNEWVLLPPL